MKSIFRYQKDSAKKRLGWNNASGPIRTNGRRIFFCPIVNRYAIRPLIEALVRYSRIFLSDDYGTYSQCLKFHRFNRWYTSGFTEIRVGLLVKLGIDANPERIGFPSDAMWNSCSHVLFSTSAVAATVYTYPVCGWHNSSCIYHDDIASEFRSMRNFDIECTNGNSIYLPLVLTRWQWCW